LKDRLELMATLLLALAAVATAWSSYQSNRWTAEYRKASGHTNAVRIEAARAQGLAESQTQIDAATFIQWIDAYSLRRTELVDFYFKRFREEFKPAVVAWIATKPLTNPHAPLTPFVMPQYKLAASKEARQLDAEADASSALGQEYSLRGTDYVLAVVLFAASLFFAGISTKLGERRFKATILACGWMIFLGTVLWVATFPISISI
jgi:hypothetical protein